jgi:hypothetical protein
LYASKIIFFFPSVFLVVVHRCSNQNLKVAVLLVYNEILYLIILNCDYAVTEIKPFTASCENAMTLSVPGVPVSCEKFPHSSQLNF